MSRRTGLSFLLLTALSLTLLTYTASAVAPSPELIDKWKSEGILEQKLAWLSSLKGAGIDVPSPHPAWNKERYAAAAALNPNAVDTVNLLVVLVDFSDNPFSNPPGGIEYAMDSILFSDKTTAGPKNPTGSMVDYYREVSYGKLHVHGHVYGPYRSSRLYSYYVGTDNGFSHSQELVQEALTLGQNEIPFASFVETGTTLVPNVAIIHAGVGAEGGGFGIWSHMSNVGSLVLRGYSFQNYNMDPELSVASPATLSAIGVFCHEFGHTLGLPDLYDTQYNPGSNGIGNWSLMASGNYNGNSQSPAELDAWCKIDLGFIPVDSIRVVSANRFNAAIPEVERNQVVYMIPDSMWFTGNPPNPSYSREYFLVENRQQVASDVGLPGSGLLIYHVDNNVGSNNNPLEYHVAVEQADGLNGLAIGGSRGDGGDPWPGATNARHFDNFSRPNSRLNIVGTVTEVGVWNISNSDSIMYANLDYNYSHPSFFLTGADSLLFMDTAAGGNNDSIIDAGETITFYCRAIDSMKPAYNWTVNLACDDPDVQFIKNNVSQGIGNLFTPFLGARKSDSAVIFQLAPNAKGKFANFTLTISADSMLHSGDRAYSKSWQFTKSVGTPTILLVDDDNGQDNQVQYENILQRLGYPYRVWDKSGGSPSAADLEAFKNVFWIQGTPPTGSFTSADLTALRTFLDNGGNLSVTSTGAAPQLQTLDSTFLQNYLHAQLGALVDAGAWFFGNTGNPVAESTKFMFSGVAPVEAYTFQNITAINGGQSAFFSSNRFSGNPNQGNCAVTYNGSFKTVFAAFPLEYLSYEDTLSGFEVPDTLMLRILQFFGGNATAVNDHGNGAVPRTFTLRQNYPNPFNPSTVISYTIPAEAGANSSRARTLLEVYNTLGQKVKTLVDMEQAPGNYKATWDGTNQAGLKVSSGVYLYRLIRGDLVDSKKMVLLK